MYRGFVMVYRKITDWEWYTNITTKVLFLHLLLKANHAYKRWEGIEINPGELITSFKHLAAETGLSVQQVRTAINNLAKTKEITVIPTNQYTLIRINNWAQYQSNNANTPLTCDQHATNTRLTPNNNIKNNNKNVRVLERLGEFVPPTLEEVKNYVLSKALNMDAEKFYLHYESNGWMIGGHKMQNWHAAVEKWALNDKIFNANQITESARDVDISEDRLEFFKHNIPTIDD